MWYIKPYNYILDENVISLKYVFNNKISVGKDMCRMDEVLFGFLNTDKETRKGFLLIFLSIT